MRLLQKAFKPKKCWGEFIIITVNDYLLGGKSYKENMLEQFLELVDSSSAHWM